MADTVAVGDLDTASATPPFRWVVLTAGCSAAELAGADLPALVREDMVEAGQRPKVEDYETGVFVVADAVQYDDDTEQLAFLQLRMFVAADSLVTVAPPDLGVVRRLNRAFATGRWSPSSPAEAAHVLVDRIVDDYEVAVRALGYDIVEVEEEVFAPDDSNPSARIYFLKRQVLAFLRRTSSLLAGFDLLVDSRTAPVPDELRDHYRDVEDHLRQAVGQLEQHSHLLTGALEANLAQISVRQNEDMRKMSAWAAIFLLPTLLAGMWGMNFEHMPETGWLFGYPLAIVTMIGASAFLYWRFRRAGWL